jgi:hypothetical protein
LLAERSGAAIDEQGEVKYTDVIPGRARRANPESSSALRSGFRVCASKSAVADLDNDVAELG